jgi:ankyrin repeat protein
MRKPTPLHDTTNDGDEERVSSLLRDGADIHSLNHHGWTALTVAIKAGNVDCARLLMGHGADPHALDGEGQNALHSAAHRGQSDVVRFLLRLWLPVNLPNAAGYSPLHLAAMRANRKRVIETVSVLLASGAGVDSRNGYGTTPHAEMLHSEALRLRFPRPRRLRNIRHSPMTDILSTELWVPGDSWD